MTEVQQIPAGDGVSLAVEAGPAIGKPAILFSNSIGANLGMWDEMVARLSGEFRLIRYDTRGHGQSRMPDEPITLETLGKDVICILDALQIERVTLCGLSLGGITAQWLGVNRPDRFNGIVLANTAANFPPASMWHDRAKAVRESGLEPLVPLTIDRWLTKSFQEKNPKRVAEVATMITGTSAAGYARCCEVLASADMLTELKALQLPVRVICGEHDPSTPPARGEEMVKALPNADMTTLDAAHVSAIEAPDAFAESLRSFGQAHAK